MIRDPLTAEVVLVGATRSIRPNEFANGPEDRCAFCPGHEALTPLELARIERDGTWSARAFRNLYPAIEPPSGIHEVIVDAPDHGHEVTGDGMQLWRERYAAALAEIPQSFPVLFKNRGAYAGATMMHPHTQLIALPERPPRWQSMLGGACILCGERDRARSEGTIVFERSNVTAFVRSSSRFARALTLLPSDCTASILHDETAWMRTGDALRACVDAMVRVMGEQIPFNVLVYSDPHDSRFHWHIELLPRTNTLAGFELSSGAFIRGAGAEESADLWRRMIGTSDGPL